MTKSNLRLLLFLMYSHCVKYSRKKYIETSFSQIKTHLRGSLNDKSLSNLMKIALESPAKLTDNHLEVVDVCIDSIPYGHGIGNSVI